MKSIIMYECVGVGYLYNARHVENSTRVYECVYMGVHVSMSVYELRMESECVCE